MDDHPAVAVHQVGDTLAFAGHDHDDDDASEENVQYLKRLYEMRTWDMYVRITEARKQREELKGTTNIGGGVRGVVPMIPVLDHPDHHMLSAAEAQQQLLGASFGDNTSSDHEMIFSCDME